MTTYFEDFTVGDRKSFGSYEVTAEEIRSFARQYDPQPFHLDDSGGEDSVFDGLVASGWHTAAMTMRMLVDHRGGESESMGSPGVDRLRWKAPVRPGDVLSVDTEVVETEVWDDDKGLVTNGVTTRNDDGEAVMTMDAQALFRRR